MSDPSPIQSTPEFAVTLTDEQRNLVVGALFDKLFESKRYASGTKVANKPGPEESCCVAHLARYESHRNIYLNLKQRVTDVKAVIALFELTDPKD